MLFVSNLETSTASEEGQIKKKLDQKKKSWTRKKKVEQIFLYSMENVLSWNLVPWKFIQRGTHFLNRNLHRIQKNLLDFFFLWSNFFFSGPTFFFIWPSSDAVDQSKVGDIFMWQTLIPLLLRIVSFLLLAFFFISVYISSIWSSVVPVDTVLKNAISIPAWLNLRLIAAASSCDSEDSSTNMAQRDHW